MITWFVDWQKLRRSASSLGYLSRVLRRRSSKRAEAAQLQAQAQALWAGRALGGALPTPVWTSLLSPSSAAPHLRFPRRHQISHLQQSATPNHHRWSRADLLLRWTLCKVHHRRRHQWHQHRTRLQRQRRRRRRGLCLELHVVSRLLCRTVTSYDDLCFSDAVAIYLLHSLPPPLTDLTVARK
eukprot:COSAG01_NODE_1204_length_11247_cov_5.362397_4_plen_183_part_00